jgi:hypothetical protein
MEVRFQILCVLALIPFFGACCTHRQISNPTNVTSAHATMIGSLTQTGNENKVVVSGTVRDLNGAAVAGAQILLTLKKCKCIDCPPGDECKCCPNQRTATSNESGGYSLSIAHGTYHVLVSSSGRQAELDLDLNEGTTRTADFTVK